MLFCCLAGNKSHALDAVARACSPRVDVYRDESAVVFDVSGLSRVLGSPATIAEEVGRLAVAEGLTARVAVTGTRTSAWLLAHARQGITVVPEGGEAKALARLPLAALRTLGARHWALGSGTRHLALGTSKNGASIPDPVPSAHRLVPDLLLIFSRWGLRTLGDLARLPLAEIRTRCGEAGARLHQAARGEDAAPLVPAIDPVRFVERLELEWPIEGLEPLSFVLARLCEALSAALERADRGAVTLNLRLRLVTRETYTRILNLPAPMREARVLRTLLLLDLESHPPPAAIDIVELELGVTPGRIVQGSLLASTVPSPEDLATLVARLHALMGETRVGCPTLVDSYDERAVAMGVVHADQGTRHKAEGTSEELCLVPCLRRFRIPLMAHVRLERGAPIHVLALSGGPGGRVVTRAGPWRSSGRWWALDQPSWDRDEWDVELEDGVFRLARDRITGQWSIDGVVD